MTKLLDMNVLHERLREEKHMKKSTFKKIERLAKMRMRHKIYAGKTEIATAN